MDSTRDKARLGLHVDRVPLKRAYRSYATAEAGREPYTLTVDMAGVLDLAGNAGAGQASTRWETRALNHAPFLGPLADRFIGFGSTLLVTNAATDPDATDRLRFSLDPGAPAGMVIHPTNGVLRWRPAFAQVPGSNEVTVRVTDDGVPPLSSAQSFKVIANDILELVLGEVVVRAGTNGAVGLRLFSSAGLTNLEFTVEFLPDRLTNVSLAAVSPVLASVTTRQLTSTNAVLKFRTASGRVLQGTQELAQLVFLASPDQHSAFVPLRPVGIVALSSANLRVTNSIIRDGRVVVLAEESLLEAILSADGRRQLALYGKPGHVYDLESTADLVSREPWRQRWRSPMLRVLRVFEVPEDEELSAFYRARELVTTEPLILLGTAFGQSMSLSLFGEPGQVYVLESTESLQAHPAWVQWQSVKISNSFQEFPLMPTSRMRFLRARGPIRE